MIKLLSLVLRGMITMDDFKRLTTQKKEEE